MNRPTRLDPTYINRHLALPYELTVDEVEQAVAETYRLFHGINDFLAGAGFRPLEELILGNSFSGILSEFLVKNIARASATLEANLKVGGHPDFAAERTLLVEPCAQGRRRNRSEVVNPEGRLAGTQPRRLLAHDLPLRRRRVGQRGTLAYPRRGCAADVSGDSMREAHQIGLVILRPQRSFAANTDSDKRAFRGIHHNEWRRKAAQQLG